MPTKKVLVVDDSRLIRQVLQDALSASQYEVTTASDGAEALRLIDESRPDVVIADVLMPRMDGWALCERLRRRKTTRELPLILLTTERDVPKRIKGLELGADDYICKPFSKEEVVARVGAVLRRVPRTRGKAAKRDADPLHLAGRTDHITVPDLLQLMTLNAKTGALNVRGQSVARIYFKDGRIINAETKSLRGKKALFRIMAWPEAEFEFEPGPPPREVETALTESTSTVLMEGFAQLDELREMSGALPPLDRRIRAVDAPSLRKEKLGVTERIIMRSAGGGTTLEEVLDAVPDHDLAVYTSIVDLLRRGLLEVVS